MAGGLRYAWEGLLFSQLLAPNTKTEDGLLNCSRLRISSRSWGESLSRAPKSRDHLTMTSMVLNEACAWRAPQPSVVCAFSSF